MTDIVERLRDMVDGGSGERRALELMEEAADEIEQWRRTLQSIRDERADVVEVREEQMLAEIKRRGEETEQLREIITSLSTVPYDRAVVDEIARLVDALDSKEDPWAENSRLLAEVHELRAEVEYLREEVAALRTSGGLEDWERPQ